VLASAFSIAHAFLRGLFAAMGGFAAWSTLLPGPFLVNVFRGAYFWGLLVYGLLVGLAQSTHYQRANRATRLDMARLERSFAEARLNALRMQLDPHFLFNALNTISAQITPAPKLARQMIGHLGDLLRASLDSGNRPLISLAEELDFLGHYLAIQALRFGDNLRIDLAVDDEARLALVPNLLMQPLVENAIRHGISPRARGGVITIGAARHGEALVIHVLDDGVGLPPGWNLDGARGLGLSITRERVAGLQPGLSRFEVTPRAGGGTDVHVVLPYRTAAPA
jgi:two-component system LytT family sensor kinase